MYIAYLMVFKMKEKANIFVGVYFLNFIFLHTSTPFCMYNYKSFLFSCITKWTDGQYYSSSNTWMWYSRYHLLAYW